MTGRKLRITFHWLTLALIAAAYAIAFLREDIEDPDSKLFWLDCHRALGLVILLLTAVRLISRLRFPVPALHEPTAFLRLAAKASHGLLYLGLVALPLLGWAQSSAKARKFKLFDVQLPSLVHHDGDLAAVLSQWHETVAWGMLALIGLHSLAALFHHFVRRDTVLVDMVRLREA